jgi:uncharacterized protein (TIGR01777 family)
MMQIFMTGGTGFVGPALVRRLRRDGHALRLWVRSPERAREQLRELATQVELVAADGGAGAMQAAIADADAIVNLAGEPVIGKRWTERQKRALWDSRVGITEQIVAAMAATPRPRALVSASAVGYYGDTGSREVDEDSPPASGFLAELTVAWEKAALRAVAQGRDTRVVLVRVGLVLGQGGGVLGQMLPVFKLGLGGPLGSGDQYFPWVHLDDLVELFASAITEAKLHGPVNGVAPGIVTNREFARALGRVLHRPAIFRVPSFALRIALGESAAALVHGQRVIPRRTQAQGFRFAHPELDAALAELTGAAG